MSREFLGGIDGYTAERIDEEMYKEIYEETSRRIHGEPPRMVLTMTPWRNTRKKLLEDSYRNINGIPEENPEEIIGAKSAVIKNINSKRKLLRISGRKPCKRGRRENL